MFHARKSIAQQPSEAQKSEVNTVDQIRLIKFILQTSLHTNSSNGKVVNMFSPNENRAMLIKILSFQRKI